MKRSLILFLIAGFSILSFSQVNQPTLTHQRSNTKQLLIAVSPVNSKVVWAAGTGGTYTRGGGA